MHQREEKLKEIGEILARGIASAITSQPNLPVKARRKAVRKNVDGEEDVLSVLATHGEATAACIADAMLIDASTVRRRLKPHLDNGAVIKRGRGPSTSYRLVA
ncbi:hypothetical protein [Cerasicoccus fimbriatus]|uniref:hypothetical protein n=1 Tax=Cerasicoccus fimbriatus TaxID=3014554 RepID=UPI0022B55944|nr:hypothetical protein [Cerasicoccus sp. TK19100]